MKKIHWLWFAFALASTALIIFAGIHIRGTRYVWNYFSAVGIRRHISVERLIRRYGEPNDIIINHTRTFARVHFERFDVVVPYCRETSAFCGVFVLLYD